jgi:hypothetical protein
MKNIFTLSLLLAILFPQPLLACGRTDVPKWDWSQVKAGDFILHNSTAWKFVRFEGDRIVIASKTSETTQSKEFFIAREESIPPAPQGRAVALRLNERVVYRYVVEHLDGMNSQREVIRKVGTIKAAFADQRVLFMSWEDQRESVDDINKMIPSTQESLGFAVGQQVLVPNQETPSVYEKGQIKYLYDCWAEVALNNAGGEVSHLYDTSTLKKLERSCSP